MTNPQGLTATILDVRGSFEMFELRTGRRFDALMLCLAALERALENERPLQPALRSFICAWHVVNREYADDERFRFLVRPGVHAMLEELQGASLLSG